MPMVNTAILRSPWNWITILLMLLIAGAIGSLLLQLAGVSMTGNSNYVQPRAGGGVAFGKPQSAALHPETAQQG